jgi:hypothetical protein
MALELLDTLGCAKRPTITLGLSSSRGLVPFEPITRGNRTMAFAICFVVHVCLHLGLYIVTVFKKYCSNHTTLVQMRIPFYFISLLQFQFKHCRCFLS